MKIAINTLLLYKTKVGMGKYIVELVNRVPKKDKRNKYLLYVSRDNRHFFNLSSDNIEIKEIPRIFSNPFLKIFWEQCFLPFYIWKNNVDLYHAPGFVLPFFRINKVPFLMTVADMTFFSHPQHHKTIKNIYFKHMIPFSLKKAEKVITISENTKKDVIEQTNTVPSKIKSILLGVDKIFLDKKNSRDKKVLDKYNIKKPYILFVGMLEPRKNIKGLIEAFYLVQNKHDNDLIIVGKKGWMYQDIFKLVKKLKLEGEVIFTGYLPDEDLPSLYSNATCFVYPSFYEGFGIPIVEAMACGCPVITSNNSSMREVAGEAAILVNPYNVEEIKDAIEKVIYNPKEKKRLQKLGFQNVKRFNWDKMAEETINMYNKFLTTNNITDKNG